MIKSVARTAASMLVAALVAAPAFAQSPQQLADDATRYMAMGDSLAAGFKAQPATQGYAFLLYQTGVFDRMPHTLFNDIGVVGATSGDVLKYQVPLAFIPAALGGFQAQYITLNVGGNDIAALRALAATNPPPDVLGGAIIAAVLAYRRNLEAILGQLASQLPNVKIFVANQYTVPEIEALFPGAPESSHSSTPRRQAPSRRFRTHTWSTCTRPSSTATACCSSNVTAHRLSKSTSPTPVTA